MLEQKLRITRPAELSLVGGKSLVDDQSTGANRLSYRRKKRPVQVVKNQDCIEDFSSQGTTTLTLLGFKIYQPTFAAISACP